MTAIVAIRIRGVRNVAFKTAHTLKQLKLTRNNHAVLLPKSETSRGMLKKAKDYLTWGEATPETVKLLLSKRGRLKGNKPLTDQSIKAAKAGESIDDLAKKASEDPKALKKIKDLKPVFRLSPPKKGFKNTKTGFSIGGDLGYRGEKINDLLKKMI